jgi:type II secretory pathway pseudopilin PulG
MKLFIHRKIQGGFTLIETLIAVLILVFAILGPFALSAQSLRASRDARSELVASYLALEGIEIVHNIRDNNSGGDLTVERDEWMEDIISNCNPNGCVPDITEQEPPDVWAPTTLIACPPGLCPGRSTVYYNPVTGLYRQSSSALAAPWRQTIYTRTLSVVGVPPSPNPQQQIRITSTVTYLGYGNKTRTISVADSFYNWFPALQ